jgi:hypothetical protein
MAGKLRDGEPWLAIFRILDAPTWPLFRSFLESIFILAIGPNTLIPVFINFLLFLILFLILVSVFSREIKRGRKPENSFWGRNSITFGIWTAGSILFFTSLHSSFYLYIFSGMYELQGSLFFLLILYGIYRYPEKSNLLWMATLGLLFTKYPYYILFIFGYIPWRIGTELEQWKSFMEYILDYFRTNLKKDKTSLAISVLVFASLFALTYFYFSKESLGSKPFLVSFQIFILSSLFLVHTLLSRRRESPHIPNESDSPLPDIRFDFYRILLPGLIWIFLHPDRVGSNFLTIQHSQGSIADFVFFSYFWNQKTLLFAWTIGLGMEIFLQKNKMIPRSIYLLVTIIFIGISLLTKNQQERHIYHLIPGIYFLFFLRTLDLAGYIRERFLRYSDENQPKSGSAKNTRISSPKDLLQLNSNPNLSTLFFLGSGFLFMSMGAIFFLQNQNSCYPTNKKDIRWTPRETRKILNDFFLTEFTGPRFPVYLENLLDPGHTKKQDTEVEFVKYMYENRIPYSLRPKEFRYSGNTLLVSIREDCPDKKGNIPENGYKDFSRVTRSKDANLCISILYPP